MEKTEESEWNGGSEVRLAETAEELDQWRNTLSELRARLESLMHQRRETRDLDTFKPLDTEVRLTMRHISAAKGRIRSLEQEYNSLRDELRHEHSSPKYSHSPRS
ncbi:MAG: hypothetical protein ACE5KH_00735 [Candidatus Geothermarchaeales archaeon]